MSAVGVTKSYRSAASAKQLVQSTAWAIRILTIFSIVFAIVDLTTLEDVFFGVCMCITASLSLFSTLNFNCCCYSDCSRSSICEKRCGLGCVYVWTVFTNMGYISMFAYSIYVWGTYGQDRRIHKDYEPKMLTTLFAFTLMINFTLSIMNLYSMCIVYRYGCCYMNGIDKELQHQSLETAVVINQQLTTIGGPLPENVSRPTAPPTGHQFGPGPSFPQNHPYLAYPYTMPVQQHQNAGVTTWQ
ncbi:uncharacterized protein LOC128202820 [Mya arenaria]|uniref:uncharacterized protein LOC128202820 n=1 Tax=Mya arenaria TaxID=6604 RepID=UPI0022E1C694|nr:uncharacterized protein LOC128202820 [Mya arenaria]